MIKLVKNELYKIFHKKLLYIVLVFALGVTLLFSSLDKIFESDAYDSVIQNSSNKVAMYENNGDVTSPSYLDFKSQLETYKLLKEKNIKENSPEEYYVLTDVSSNIYSYLSSKNGGSKSLLEENEKKLNDSINFLDNFDWKVIVNNKVREVMDKECNNEINCELLKNEKLNVLKYRLTHEIPFSNNHASVDLDSYLADYEEYLEVKDSNDEMLSQSSLYDKQRIIGSVETMKYTLDHELLNNDYKGDYTANNMILMFSHATFITAMVLLILSSSVVAEEYNKGTIKQLLVKPYSRTKIVISKMLAILITIILFTFVYNIFSVIILSFYYGDLSTLFTNDVLYDYTINKPFELSYILEALISFVYSLPSLILLGLFTFAMAVLTTNTAFPLGLGFCAYISESLFPVYMRRFKILSYAPTVNYNFDSYMWGRVSDLEDIFLTKSIIISVISFIVLFTIAIIVFNKRDIKNQ